MEKAAKISSEEKLAIIDAIEKQFLDNFCRGHVEYNPLDAQDYLATTGKLKDCEIDISRQFEILKELAADHLGIEIDFFKNDIDPEHHCVTDALHRGIRLTDNSSERERELYDIRVYFGSVYFRTSIPDIKKARAYYSKYTGKLIFDDDFVGYSIEFSPGGEVYHSYLHDGRPPQKIIKCVMKDHKKDEYVGKEQLNKEIYPEQYKKNNWVIPKNKSIKHHIFARDKELWYFFDMRTHKMAYITDTIKGLARDEVDKILSKMKTRKKKTRSK